MENVTNSSLRIGTRGSDLALWQAHTIAGLLGDMGVDTEINIIKTQGDKIDNVPFSKLEGKGFFTKELEDAQLAGRVDFAVHSLKDLTTDQPEGLVLAAMVGREDPRELLLALPDAIDPDRQAAGDVLPLKDGVRIGTSAARRQAQINQIRPDLEILDLRGNVPTRINKLREGQYDAIILARAGVVRLELEVGDLFTSALPITEFIPAPGQGMLGIQCGKNPQILEILKKLHCEDAGQAVAAERLLLNRLDGGCQLPFGVNVQQVDGQWKLEAFLASTPDDANPLRLNLSGTTAMEVAEAAWSQIAHHQAGQK